MIDLYFAPTANGQRARLALEETGLNYQLHRLDLAKGQQRAADYLRINPAGLIPAIVDSDGPGGEPLALTQSGAIVLYCAEKAGKFVPKDPVRRALAMQWFMQAASDISGTSSTIFRLEVTAPDKSPANVEYFRRRLLDFFSTCDSALAGREYLAGELSVADLMLYPNCAARRQMIEQAGGNANLLRWGAAMAARPAVARAMSNG